MQRKHIHREFRCGFLSQSCKHDKIQVCLSVRPSIWYIISHSPKTNKIFHSIVESKYFSWSFCVLLLWCDMCIQMWIVCFQTSIAKCWSQSMRFIGVISFRSIRICNLQMWNYQQKILFNKEKQCIYPDWGSSLSLLLPSATVSREDTRHSSSTSCATWPLLVALAQRWAKYQ